MLVPEKMLNGFESETNDLSDAQRMTVKSSKKGAQTKRNTTSCKKEDRTTKGKKKILPNPASNLIYTEKQLAGGELLRNLSSIGNLKNKIDRKEMLLKASRQFQINAFEKPNTSQRNAPTDIARLSETFFSKPITINVNNSYDFNRQHHTINSKGSKVSRPSSKAINPYFLQDQIFHLNSTKRTLNDKTNSSQSLLKFQGQKRTARTKPVLGKVTEFVSETHSFAKRNMSESQLIQEKHQLRDSSKKQPFTEGPRASHMTLGRQQKAEKSEKRHSRSKLKSQEKEKSRHSYNPTKIQTIFNDMWSGKLGNVKYSSYQSIKTPLYTELYQTLNNSLLKKSIKQFSQKNSVPRQQDLNFNLQSQLIRTQSNSVDSQPNKRPRNSTSRTAEKNSKSRASANMSIQNKLPRKPQKQIPLEKISRNAIPIEISRTLIKHLKKALKK